MVMGRFWFLVRVQACGKLLVLVLIRVWLVSGLVLALVLES